MSIRMKIVKNPSNNSNNAETNSSMNLLKTGNMIN